MGNCSNPCAQGQRHKYATKSDLYDQMPSDTQKYRSIPGPQSAFSAILGNIKLKKCPYRSIGISISIDDIQYYKLANKTVSDGQDIKWKIQKRIDFLKNQLVLRTSFVIIKLIDYGGLIVAELKINLYAICVGPYHHDFSINFANGKTGRISFDFRVSQLIQISLNSLQSEINLMKKHPGQNFSFSIQTIVSHYTNLSMPSYIVQVVVDQKMSSNKQIEDQTDIKVEGHTGQTRGKKRSMKQYLQLKQKSNLIWRRSDCSQMPSISMKLLLHQLHHSYLQLLLIKSKQTSQSQQQSSLQSSQLFAQCYVSFHKLFTKQPQTIQKKNKLCEQRIIQVNQKLWVHGREIGQARLVFQIINEKYIKQMQVCVRTEQGVRKTSPVFATQDQRTGESFNQAQLINIVQRYTSLTMLRGLSINEKTQDSHIRKVIIDDSYTHENVKIVNHFLYIFISKILIDIGDKIAAYVYEEDQRISQMCWLILTFLINRGEFMLCHIGFDEHQRKQIEKNSLSKMTKRKVQVGLMYQQFLYKLLGFALTSLNFKGSSFERSFAQKFCAYAYFRIPKFRVSMLSILINQNDPQVPQWRGIEFSLNEDTDYTDLREDVDSFTALFDWEHCFHKCLTKIKNQKEDNLEFQEIIANQDWKYRFRRRGPAFFCFIKFWIIDVEQMVVKSRDIQWKFFPGYNRILKAFFLQLKKRKILQYPDSLKQAANLLIINQKIFSPIVTILFNKASIYDPLVVIKVIQLINTLLSTLKRKNKSIHPLFNYSHFFKGIRMILESQFLVMLESAIIMIYTHFDMFNYQFRKNLGIYLLKNVFFKFYLHWSDNIRSVFQHFLIYRIYHDINQTIQVQYKIGQANSTKLKIQYVNAVKQQYQATIIQLENAKTLYKLKNQTKTLQQIVKDLHKIMKKKLISKKLEKTKKQLLQPQKDTQQFGQDQYPKNSIPLGGQRRRNNLNQKHRYQQRLVQPRIQHTQSQSTPQSRLQVLHKYPKDTEQDEQQIINHPTSYTVKNQIIDNTMKRIDTETNDFTYKFRSKDYNTLFNMFEEMQGHIVKATDTQLQYINKAEITYQSIKNNYNQIVQANGKVEAPKIIRQEMYIDKKDYIPDKMDDW